MIHLELKDTLWSDGTFILSHDVIENYGKKSFANCVYSKYSMETIKPLR